MAVEHLKGALVYSKITSDPIERVPSTLVGARIHRVIDTVEVSVDASASSTYTLARIPSDARILLASTLYIDDLDEGGSPTLDIGIASSAESFVTDADALNDGLDATVAGSHRVIKDPATAGLPVWDFVDGVTEDPQELVDIIVTLVDAAADAGGSITLELFYTLD